MQFTEIHRSKKTQNFIFLELNRERRRSSLEESSKWERNLRQEYQNKNYRTSFADFRIFGYFSENGGSEFFLVIIFVLGQRLKDLTKNF